MPQRRSLSRKSRPIYFVYVEQQRKQGTTVMRGRQLSAIAERFLPARTIEFVPMGSPFRDATLFLTKAVLKHAEATELEELRKRGNQLLLDPVDGPLSPELAAHADVIVAASFTAFDDYCRAFPDAPVALLHHHVDPRIRTIDMTMRQDVFRAGYFGKPKNTLVTPRIEERVDFFRVRASRRDDEWVRRLPDYTFHYAVRRTREQDEHKPFLKGFTAAACHANLLIQHSETEALRWVGEDYPYLLRGAVTEGAVIDALEAVEASYGSAEWRQGLSIMNEVRARTSEEEIGGQLTRLFSTVTDWGA
jgi:hypothetical protein